MPKRFTVTRSKDKYFRGYIILDPRWTASERRELLKELKISNTERKSIMKFDFNALNFEILDANTNAYPDIFINQNGVTFTKRYLMT